MISRLFSIQDMVVMKHPDSMIWYSFMAIQHGIEYIIMPCYIRHGMCTNPEAQDGIWLIDWIECNIP